MNAYQAEQTSGNSWPVVLPLNRAYRAAQDVSVPPEPGGQAAKYSKISKIRCSHFHLRMRPFSVKCAGIMYLHLSHP